MRPSHHKIITENIKGKQFEDDTEKQARRTSNCGKAIKVIVELASTHPTIFGKL